MTVSPSPAQTSGGWKTVVAFVVCRSSSPCCWRRRRLRRRAGGPYQRSAHYPSPRHTRQRRGRRHAGTGCEAKRRGRGRVLNERERRSSDRARCWLLICEARQGQRAPEVRRAPTSAVTSSHTLFTKSICAQRLCSVHRTSQARDRSARRQVCRFCQHRHAPTASKGPARKAVLTFRMAGVATPGVGGEGGGCGSSHHAIWWGRDGKGDKVR
jgi:hypothetical protein